MRYVSVQENIAKMETCLIFSESWTNLHIHAVRARSLQYEFFQSIFGLRADVRICCLEHSLSTPYSGVVVPGGSTAVDSPVSIYTAELTAPTVQPDFFKFHACAYFSVCVFAVSLIRRNIRVYVNHVNHVNHKA